MVPIKGIIKDSMLDWPGKLSYVIFTGGCNLRCAYCHNPQFVEGWQDMEEIPKSEVMAYLKRKRRWIEGVVLSGGEPTIHSDLPDIIKEIRALDFPIKLETNGTNSDLLEDMLKERLLDCVSMDIKWPIERYRSYSFDISKSINLIRKAGIDYEFNTTVVPGIVDGKDIEDIAKYISGAKNYTLQQFKSENIHLLDKVYINKQPYSKAEMEQFAQIARQYVPNTRLR